MKWNMAIEDAPWLEIDVFMCDTVEVCNFIKYWLSMSEIQKSEVNKSMVISIMLLRGDSLGYLERVIIRAWAVVLLSI